jgi:hypothetical protein
MKPEQKLTACYADLLTEPSDDALEKLIQELDTMYTAPERPAGLFWADAKPRLELVSQRTLNAEALPRIRPLRLGAKLGKKKALLAVAAIVVLTLLSAALLRATGASWFRQGQIAQTSPSLSTADALLLQQLLQNKGTPVSIRQLAQSGQFTDLNLTKVTDTGNVGIQKVYADANNVVLVYTIDTSVWQTDTFCTVSQLKSRPCDSAVCPLTIMTSEKQPLPCYGSLANFGRSTIKRVAILAYYDTSSIQGNPHQLQLKISLTRRGSSSGEALDEITVPFHAEKTVITVNQTATSHGDALTLERVVITPTEARFYNSALPSAFVSPATLSIAGKTHDPDNFQIDGWTQANKLADLYGWAVTSAKRGNSVSFYDALLGQTGTWMLTETGEVNAPSYHTDTWTFTFTVS